MTYVCQRMPCRGKWQLLGCARWGFLKSAVGQTREMTTCITKSCKLTMPNPYWRFIKFLGQEASRLAGQLSACFANCRLSVGWSMLNMDNNGWFINSGGHHWPLFSDHHEPFTLHLLRAHICRLTWPRFGFFDYHFKCWCWWRPHPPCTCTFVHPACRQTMFVNAIATVPLLPASHCTLVVWIVLPCRSGASSVARGLARHASIPLLLRRYVCTGAAGHLLQVSSG